MNKLLFFIKRQPIILVVGNGRHRAKETIIQIIKSDVLIFESDLSEAEEFSFFLRKSKSPILVVAEIGPNPEEVLKIKNLAKVLPARGFLVLNFDDETMRQIKNEVVARSLTYGFWEGAEIKATDLNINQEANFKINYQGNIVPFWLKNISNQEQIYNILAAISVGIIRGINLVEISQSLKSWHQ